MSESAMREFWDARAAEDAYYFVDNRLSYRDPETELFWASGDKIVDLMLAELGAELASDATLLEIGCGIGRITRALAARAARVIALDVSPEMLSRAQSFNPSVSNVEWVLGDGSSLSGVDDASVDACLSYVVFQHIPDEAITMGYVREMGRVLRPGGWSAFQVSDLPPLHSRAPLAQRLRSRWEAIRGRGPGGQDHPAWRGAPTDLGRLREVAGEAGLETVRLVGEGTAHCLVLLEKRGQ